MKSSMFALAAVATGVLPCFAGEAVDEFVRVARKVYANDVNCTTSIVQRFSEKAGDDDRKPGMVDWVVVEGARNVRDIGG